MTRSCPVCGAAFNVRKHQAHKKFCGDRCKNRSYYDYVKVPVLPPTRCLRCGDTIPGGRGKVVKMYCNRRCAVSYRRRAA